MIYRATMVRECGFRPVAVVASGFAGGTIFCRLTDDLECVYMTMNLDAGGSACIQLTHITIRGLEKAKYSNTALPGSVVPDHESPRFG